MPKRISQFLPIRSVPALLCFLVLMVCSALDTGCQRLIHHNGKLYLFEADKGFGERLWVYQPPAVPGEPGQWIPQTGPPPPDTPLKNVTPVDEATVTANGSVGGSAGGGVSNERGGRANPRAVRRATSTATSGSGAVSYILDEYGFLSKFDPVSNMIVAQLDFNNSIPGGAAISGHLAVTPDSNFAFITANSALPSSAQGSATVLVADLNSFTIVSTITLPVSAAYVPWSPAVAITPDGKLAYVVTQPFSGSGPSNVFVIDVATRAITMTIPVATDSHLGQIAIAPDGTKAYLVDSLDTSSFLIPVLDLQSNTLDTPISIFPVTLNSQIGPSYVALHPDGTRLYFISLTGGPVQIVSLVTKAVTGNIPLATDGRPSFGSQPIFTPDGIFLSFMNGPESLVWVNTLTDTVDSTITLSPVPGGAIRNTGFFWLPGS
jgi:hypothetical protein